MSAPKMVKFRGGIVKPLTGLEHVVPIKPVTKYKNEWRPWDPDTYSELRIDKAIAYIYSRGHFRGRRGDLTRDFRSPGWDHHPCPTCGRPT